MNKKIILAGAFCALTAQGAYAGGVVEPVMEPEVVIAETASSSEGVIIPLLLLLVIAAAIAGEGAAP